MIAAREGVQILRGHMVRRTPTKAELASRSSFALTDRDQQILTAVYSHGFLTAELIEVAFYPRTSNSPAFPSSSALERLRQLWLWSYLERVELPVAPALGGRRPYLYALGARGVPVVTERLGVGAKLVQQRRIGRLDDRSIEHDLTASRFWANLHALLPATGIRRWRWTGERDLRALRLRVEMPRSTFGAPFVPDGHFALTYPDGLLHAGVVEVDNGTLPLRRFRRKLRIFELARAQEILESAWGGYDFEVFVLAPSPARLAHLHAAARDEVHEDWWDSYYFAAFARLEPGAFDAGWWRLDSDDPDDTHGLLFDAAYGPPPELASPPEPPVPSAPPEPSSVLRSPPDVAQPGAVVGAGA